MKEQPPDEPLGHDQSQEEARQSALKRALHLAEGLQADERPLLQQFGRQIQATFGQVDEITTTAEIESSIEAVMRVVKAYGLNLVPPKEPDHDEPN